MDVIGKKNLSAETARCEDVFVSIFIFLVSKRFPPRQLTGVSKSQLELSSPFFALPGFCIFADLWPGQWSPCCPSTLKSLNILYYLCLLDKARRQKNVANVPKKYLRACVSDPGYNTRPLSQLIFCLVSVSPLSSQSLLVPQLNIFTSPSAGQLLTCLSAKLFSWPSTAQLPGTISMCVT